jgi:hypothetical protein
MIHEGMASQEAYSYRKVALASEDILLPICFNILKTFSAINPFE